MKDESVPSDDYFFNLISLYVRHFCETENIWKFILFEPDYLIIFPIVIVIHLSCVPPTPKTQIYYIAWTI